MSRHIRSPLEHGELEASPFYSPEMDIEINVADDSHMSEVDSNEPDSPRNDDEEELGPDIKPPQAKIKKDKHKHKHKRKTGDRDRDRDGYVDRGSKQSSRSSTGDIIRSKDPKDRSGVRSSASRRDTGSIQIDRDRRARLIRQREEELARREKSLQERERLEKLEMERRRLDREISKREQEQREKIRKEREAEKDRQQRMERNRARIEKEEHRRPMGRQNVQTRYDRDDYYRPRSRSPPVRRGGDNMWSQDKWQKGSRNDEAPERIRPRSAINQSQESTSSVSSQVKSLSQKINNKGEVSSDESDSDSDDSSSGESDSDNGSSMDEKKTKTKEVVKHTEHMKVKSRFDSESEQEQSYESDKDFRTRSDEDGEYNDYLDDTPPQSPIELKADLPPYYPAIQGCRNVEEFNCLYRIEEGTYGVVYGARDKKTDEIVALKRLKMEKEKDGFPITSLREINTLLKAQHPNIVTVREIVVGSNMDRIYIVMDYVEHDLKDLMRRMKEPFMIGEVKTLMIQLLRGVAHMHDNWIIHRDLKTSNLLLSHSGILKIGDFGLAREYGSPLKPYTPIVVTLWYRSPELLLGTKEYSCPIDLWSVGCIMAEFLTRDALFPGKSEIDELNRIFKELGTPNETIWPGVSQLKGWKTCSFADYPYNQLRKRFGGMITEKGFDLMNRLLTYDPSKRITAEEGMKHEWFKESPAPVDPSMFPTWPTKNEQSSRPKNSPKPPSGGKAYSQLNDDDEKLGFRLKNATNSGGGFSLKF